MISENKEIKIGDAVIDDQHFKLIQIYNELEKCLDSIDVFERLSEMIQGFKNVVVEHFRYEEELMLKIHYKDLENHAIIHQEGIEKIEHLERLNNDGALEAVQKTYEILGEWITEHTLNEDRKYMPDLLEWNKNHPN